MIKISHTHESGMIVTGTRKGDGAVEAIKRHGLRWSRNIGVEGAWYVRRSRDRQANLALIELLAVELEQAGFAVEVSVDDTPRSTAEIEADRFDRVAARVERYEEIADKAADRGTVRLDSVRRSRSQIPLGQPIVSDRFAAYVRRLNKSEEIGHRDLDKAGHYQERAQTADTHQHYRYNPRVITRRIEKLEAEIRDLDRKLTRIDGSRYFAQHTDEREDARERLQARREQIQEQLAYWRGELDRLVEVDAYRPWGPQHFRKGDEALLTRTTWYPVLRVNAKSLTVPALVGMGNVEHPDGQPWWTDRVPYDKVYGRRRDGEVLHRPPAPSDTETDTGEAGER